MVEADTIPFKDMENGDESLVIVRYQEDRVLLALSARSNGDMEVAFDKETARKLLRALSRAVEPG